MASLAEKIKQYASEIGIDKIGIVAATRLDHEERNLNEWLSRGFHGNMAWMEREPEKRADPRVLFPEAKSVIVAAINYYTISIFQCGSVSSPILNGHVLPCHPQ